MFSKNLYLTRRPEFQPRFLLLQRNKKHSKIHATIRKCERWIIKDQKWLHCRWIRHLPHQLASLNYLLKQEGNCVPRATVAWVWGRGGGGGGSLNWSLSKGYPITSLSQEGSIFRSVQNWPCNFPLWSAPAAVPFVDRKIGSLWKHNLSPRAVNLR